MNSDSLRLCTGALNSCGLLAASEAEAVEGGLLRMDHDSGWMSRMSNRSEGGMDVGYTGRAGVGAGLVAAMMIQTGIRIHLADAESWNWTTSALD